jgi:hypothetical protein
MNQQSGIVSVKTLGIIIGILIVGFGAVVFGMDYFSKPIPTLSEISEDSNPPIVPIIENEQLELKTKTQSPDVLECTNFDCLIAAAKICAPARATLESTLSSPLSIGYIYTVKPRYEIKGMFSGKCRLSLTILDQKVGLNESAVTKENYLKFINLMNEKANTQVFSEIDIKKMLDDVDSGQALLNARYGVIQSNEFAKSTIGSIISCSLPPNELAQKINEVKISNTIKVLSTYPEPSVYCKTEYWPNYIP